MLISAIGLFATGNLDTSYLTGNATRLLNSELASISWESCEDLDGGKNFDEKGLVFGYDVDGGEHQYADTCNGRKVAEYYCKRGAPKVKSKRFDFCYDGAGYNLSCGDLDDDGDVDAADADFITAEAGDSTSITYLTVEEARRADVNLDGKVDFVDQYAIGTDSRNLVCNPPEIAGASVMDLLPSRLRSDIEEAQEASQETRGEGTGEFDPTVGSGDDDAPGSEGEPGGGTPSADPTTADETCTPTACTGCHCDPDVGMCNGDRRNVYCETEYCLRTC